MSARGIAPWMVAAGCLVSPPSFAEERRWDLGFRSNIVGAEGVPANDVLGYGLFARYRLNERWLVGFAVDYSAGFDVERPYEFVGIVADPDLAVIDASADLTMLTSWIEREYDRPGRVDWFWSAGLGVATVDIADLQGTRADGAPFDIAQDVGTELIATAGGGLRWRFASRWAFEAALRLDQHFTDWTATDRVSGVSADLDDYLVKGIHLGVSFRF